MASEARKCLVLNLPSGYEQPDSLMSIGIVEKLFEPWRVLFHPMDAIKSFDIPLSHRNLQKPQFVLVSTKEAFAYFRLERLLLVSSYKRSSQPERSAAK